jgi:NAD(P)H-hydrate epimerase
VADIGHPPALLAEPSAGDRLLLDSTWFRRALPARNAAAHKGDFGHLLVAAGSRRYPGAAQLAALGGLRSGAGLVTLAAPGALAPALVPALPELMPLMLEESTGAFAAGAASTLAGHFRGKDALVLGPGLTITPDTVSFAREVIATAPLPLVVDADALTILAEAPNPLTARTSPTILTPHPGELARLLSRPVAEIERDRLGAAQEAAERFGAVVVLKGAGTLVASPGQPAAVNAGGNPGMASGGMGDLLAGLIGGFLAQGLPPLVAACLGVYLHGVAGDLVAETRPWGFRACEVADGIPSAVGRLLDGYDDVDCR